MQPFLPSGVLSALEAGGAPRIDALAGGSTVQQLPISENSARILIADDGFAQSA